VLKLQEVNGLEQDGKVGQRTINLLYSDEIKPNFLAYGEKSDDGRRFMKSEEISRGFMETPAYEVLFEKLVTDAGAASEFVNRVMRANGNKQVTPIASN